MFDILKMSNNNAQSQGASVFRHGVYSLALGGDLAELWLGVASWTAEEGFRR